MDIAFILPIIVILIIILFFIPVTFDFWGNPYSIYMVIRMELFD